MVRSVEVLRRAGLVPLTRPDLLLRSVLAIRQLGPIAGAAQVAADRDHRALGLVDDLGALTFRQLDTSSNALARAWPTAASARARWSRCSPATTAARSTRWPPRASSARGCC